LSISSITLPGRPAFNYVSACRGVVESNRSDACRYPICEAEAERNAALPLLWARQRIAALSDDLEFGETAEVKREVTNLGLTYGLLTRYTSFVAVDTVVREAAEAEGAETVKQPLPLPQGVPQTAVGGGGAVPEPSSMLLWLLGIAALFLVRRRRLVKQA